MLKIRLLKHSIINRRPLNLYKWNSRRITLNLRTILLKLRLVSSRSRQILLRLNSIRRVTSWLQKEFLKARKSKEILILERALMLKKAHLLKWFLRFKSLQRVEHLGREFNLKIAAKPLLKIYFILKTNQLQRAYSPLKAP